MDVATRIRPICSCLLGLSAQFCILEVPGSFGFMLISRGRRNHDTGRRLFIFNNAYLVHTNIPVLLLVISPGINHQ
jgi:hypothetical protein